MFPILSIFITFHIFPLILILPAFPNIPIFYIFPNKVRGQPPLKKRDKFIISKSLKVMTSF